MAVLDEIDRRISVVEALKKLMDDPTADELHSIRPLVTHARWLFGPEFDSPIYASNITIRKAAEAVFKKTIDSSGIKNVRQRPDLIFAKDSTFSLTGTEQIDESNSIVNRLRPAVSVRSNVGISHPDRVGTHNRTGAQPRDAEKGDIDTAKPSKRN